MFAALALGWLALRARRASATVHGGTSGLGTAGRRGRARGAGLGARRTGLRPGHGRRRRRPRRRARLGRAALRHRPVPLAAGGLPQVRRPARQGRRGQRLRPHPLHGDRRPRGDPGAHRHDGPLRRHGVGGHRRRPARGRRGLVPARLLDHRQPRRGRAGATPPSPSARATTASGCRPIGALQSLDFRIGDPDGKAEVFRYNLATSTAVVPTGHARGRHLLLHRRGARRHPRRAHGGLERRGPAARRARSSSRRPPPSGPRRRPRPSSVSTRSPSTCGPRASTPTASASPSRSTTPGTASSGCRTASSRPSRWSATTSSTPR